MFDGSFDLDDADDLVSGLMYVPYSRFRAAFYEDNPPSYDGVETGGATPGWLGWTTEAGYLVTLTNTVIALLAGKEGKSALLKYPTSARESAQPTTIVEFVEMLKGSGISVSSG